MNRAHISSLARDIQDHADVIGAFARKETVSDAIVWREAHARITLIGARLQWMLDNLGPEPESVDPLTAILPPKPMPGVHTLGDRVPLSGRVPRKPPPEDAA